MPYDNRDKDWSYKAASQRMPRVDGNPQKLGKAKARFSPISFRGSLALPTPGFQISSL